MFRRPERRFKKQVGAPAIENSQEARKKKLLMQSRVFWSQWKRSQGFDVDEEPLDLVDGPRICNESDMKHVSSDHPCMQCVEFAIKFENNLKKLNLELVQLLKFNVDFESEGNTYYLTFKAKDEKDGENVYQAKVFDPNEDYEGDDYIEEEGEEYEKDDNGKLKRTVLIFRKRINKHFFSWEERQTLREKM